MGPRRRVLVLDPDPALRLALEREGFSVRVAASVEDARVALDAEAFTVALLDVALPGDAGVALLEALARSSPRPGVVVMTSQDPLRAGVLAMRHGADELVIRPLALPRLLSIVHALAARVPASAGEARPAIDAGPALVGVSDAMIEVSKAVGRAAATELTVLVVGESGTGKELVARALHETSARATGPFVTVNAAALPRELLESELYGHERGAFTGADQRRRGRFEQAHGGTLLLDEIGELPLEQQAKFLRALQERSVDRVGGERPVAVDVRLVAATNADLPKLVAQGRFRPDLYYRLSVLVIRLPPLRARPEDLLPIATHLCARHGGKLRGCDVVLGAGAEGALRAHDFPGNVRELESVLQRALLAGRGPIVTAAELSGAILAAGPGAAPSAPISFEETLVRLLPARTANLPSGAVHQSLFAELERALYRVALERFDGNQLQAARWLGIHRNTLHTRLGALGGVAKDAPDGD